MRSVTLWFGRVIAPLAVRGNVEREEAVPEGAVNARCALLCAFYVCPRLVYAFSNTFWRR